MGLVQVAGLAAVAATWWPAAMRAAGVAASAGATVLVESSRLVDWWPWLSWRVPPVSIGWLAAYYLCVGTTIASCGRLRRGFALAAVALLTVIVTAPWTTRAAPVAGRVRVTMLDVGQGEAILIQRAGRSAMLVDTGGQPGAFDIGSRLVTPAVWALGTRRLTALAITHGDRDHIGGAVSVTDDLRPREVWEGIAVASSADRGRLRDVAARFDIAWRTLRTGHAVAWNEVRLDALHPPEPDWERQRVRNDDSLVLRLRVGAVDVLLTGDAGAEFESRLPADLGAAVVRILKVGHHGSRTATTARLIAAYRPHVAIVSVGRGNLYGHPSPEVMARLERVGARVFRTDRDGAVSVETDGVVARVVSAGGRTWTVRAARP
jgi:competence protein ComEC